MCGRYTLNVNPADIAQRFDFDPARTTNFPTGTRMPSGRSLAIAAPKRERLPAIMTWGYINPWSTNPARPRIINARAETAADKPTFSDSFRNRRCIIPADAFFESDRSTRRQYRFSLGSGAPFAMAGIWKPTTGTDGKPTFSFVILTVPPSGQVSPIHDRMPAVLLPQNEPAWLDADITDPEELRSLLRPYPDHLITVQPASTHPTPNTPASAAAKA